ncbi:LPS export ABC transporter periplasmic protein LptC [Thermosulfurimonas sp. F29]|uniref:LPS export ABC transporter periplasmic protein LptC n=1 Tax=Thermosulfurimonas sp. F29 TaxID=2867247 RepID=UPI001C833213|nr:LPS export ABC transporter periplasmic protein LptC [Thermosulfurimonas sp. F29]MBX6423126.1 LPS export ABC transporter periplasmic protein LptC [Thermosulfurimonas sp. F29]
MARIWILITLLVFLAGGCSPAPKAVVPTKKSPPSSGPSGPKKKPEKPENSFKDLEYVFWRAGRPRWWLRAEEALRFRDRLEMKRPFVRSLERTGLELTALRGVYRFARRLFFFQGKVVLRTPDRGTLYTDRLYYWPEKKLLSGNRPLVLRNGGLVIRGKGFEYDLVSGKLRIKESTRVEFHG